MTQVIEAGAFVMPASPSFYSGPRTVGQLVDTVVARVLDRIGLPNELMRRWDGMSPRTPGRGDEASPDSPLAPGQDRPPDPARADDPAEDP
jgi:4-hydroxy-3-polyprenylbenzoate decarboxylase